MLTLYRAALGVGDPEKDSQVNDDAGEGPGSVSIRFADGVKPFRSKSKALYVPSPRERDRGNSD